MRNITTVIWDMDGTLYPETPAIKGVFKSAACDALRDTVDPALSDDHAYDMIAESRRVKGDSFSHIVENHGVDSAKLHERHHANLDPVHIERDDETVQAIKSSSQQGLRHTILTHGHMNWVEKVLEKTGLSTFFKKPDIISNEQIDFIKKHTGPEAFEAALERLGVHAENTVMIEDKASNLVHPHEMGMLTIQVHYGAVDENEPKPDYIDFRCKTPAEALEYLESLENNLAPDSPQPVQS